MEKAGIYIHIPFCKAKCNYCDFRSFAGSEDKMEQYVQALRQEIKECKELGNIEISTVFIGGGTPTVLPPKFVYGILSDIGAYRLAKDAEITVEANPGTLDMEYLRILKESGVNRLSIGLQAWQERHLKALGRIHSISEFVRNYEDAVKIGFNNINVDLMFSLAGHQEWEWQETLENVISLSPQHVSAYGLIIEENTPFGKWHSEGKLSLVSDETDRRMYYTARDILEKHGYRQYEISNFAKNGFESQHNKIYWTRANYLGFGLGAHSLFKNIRYSNAEDLERYLSKERGQYHTLSLEDAMAEFMFLGLRMTDGIDANDFYRQFGRDAFEIYGEQIKKYIKLGLLEQRDSRIALTKRGIDVSNIVFADFL